MITFYFDFASPYSYFALEPLQALAKRHHHTLQLKPILLWAVLREQGMEAPVKHDYMIHDMQRSARFYGRAYQQPEQFPNSSHRAARAFYSIAYTQPQLVEAFAEAVFHAFFVLAQDITDDTTIARICERIGADLACLTTDIRADAAKQALQHSITTAANSACLGVPFILVGTEPFFGADRLPQIEQWLRSGGF